MKPSGRAYWLRSAIASYAGCNGTRPIAKVQLEPCSAPRGESQAAAWQDTREYLLPIRGEVEPKYDLASFPPSSLSLFLLFLCDEGFPTVYC